VEVLSLVACLEVLVQGKVALDRLVQWVASFLEQEHLILCLVQLNLVVPYPWKVHQLEELQLLCLMEYPFQVHLVLFLLVVYPQQVEVLQLKEKSQFLL
jgi:hypothetical protein